MLVLVSFPEHLFVCLFGFYISTQVARFAIESPQAIVEDLENGPGLRVNPVDVGIQTFAEHSRDDGVNIVDCPPALPCGNRRVLQRLRSMKCVVQLTNS